MQITLFLNHRCNLRCTYCYTGRKFHRAMPLEVARQAVAFGLDHAAKDYLLLAFFGGEPLLEIELMEAIVAAAKQAAAERNKRLLFAVATNGTLLDARRMKLLFAHKFQVQVSLDGCREAHDATRRYRNGRSSHATIVAGLQRLRDAGFSVRVISVIDPANAAYLGESFTYLMDLGMRKIYFAPNYNGPWDDAACERFETSLHALGQRMITCFHQGEDVRLDPLNGKIVTHLAQGYQEKNLCQFGQQEIAVSPTGKLYPCDRLVGEDNKEEVCIGTLAQGLDLAKRDRLVQGKNTPDTECAQCPLMPRCMFWCGCANYETTGSTAQVAPIICWFERCFIAEADRIANIMYAEKNPVFLRRFYVPQATIATRPT